MSLMKEGNLKTRGLRKIMVYVTKISLKWVKRDLIVLPIAKLLVSRRRFCEILTLGDLRSTVPCPVSNCCHTMYM